MLEHAFSGPPFTVGIEEELMILEPEGWGLAQEIEALLEHTVALAAHDLVALLAEDADALGCRDELESVGDLLTNGTGAHRQLAHYGDNGDLRALVAEIAEHTRA